MKLRYKVLTSRQAVPWPSKTPGDPADSRRSRRGYESGRSYTVRRQPASTPRGPASPENPQWRIESPRRLFRSDDSPAAAARHPSAFRRIVRLAGGNQTSSHDAFQIATSIVVANRRCVVSWRRLTRRSHARFRCRLIATNRLQIEREPLPDIARQARCLETNTGSAHTT